MNLLAYLAIRAVVGGLLVVVFALIGEVVKPKRFAGVFGAAPSIAIANLSLVVGIESVAKAATESRAMIGGAIAMVVCCAVGVVAVRRLHALRGAGVMVLAWLVAATAAGLVFA